MSQLFLTSFMRIEQKLRIFTTGKFLFVSVFFFNLLRPKIGFFFFLGRTNLPPDRVPWKAILTLLSQCIYGGKIDNDFDQRLLYSFLEKLFNAKCFEVTNLHICLTDLHICLINLHIFHLL